MLLHCITYLPIKSRSGSIQIMISQTQQPLVGVIMGSKSDEKILSVTAALLRDFRVPYEMRIVSAHRTPQWMAEYASTAAARGLRVIIAAAGGAAHLPGMVAAHTTVPVIGVPVPATALNGIDSLLSIVQMPRGVPVATVAIGEPGAANAALLAIQMLAIADDSLTTALTAWREAQRDAVISTVLSEVQHA